MALTSALTLLRNSFRAKISIMAATIIVTTSCTLTFFFISHDRKSLTEELVRQGTLLATLLAHNARLGMFAADATSLTEVAKGAMEHEDVIAVSFVDRSGNVLAQQVRPKHAIPPPEGRLIPLPGATRPSHAIQNGAITIIAPVNGEEPHPSAEGLFFGKPGNAESPRLLGTVRLVLDTRNVNDRIRHLILFAMLSVGLFLIAGMACAYLVIRGTTRPLTALMEGVQALGTQGVYQKVAVETQDEIGRLAGAFNSMVESLQRREQENRVLEEQLRTAQKREAQEEWEQTFDTVPDLIAILDRSRRIIRINRALADHLGIRKEDASGLDGGRVCGPSITGHTIRHDMSGGDGATIEREIYDTERGRWYWLTVSPLNRLGEETAVTVHVARDITQRKAAEAERKAMQAKLIQSNKMTSLGLLVSGLAHEVNNPNSNIIFTAHLLGKAWKDAEAILDRYYREEGDFRLGGHLYSQIRESLPLHVAGIRENARRIEGIIKNLKDFVRKGKSDLAMEMDVNRIVSVAVSLINNQIKRHTTRFETSFAPDLPTVKGNPQQLEQVFINVVMNALQSLSRMDARVAVSTSRAGEGNVIVEVTDEGCGMTEEVRANIFEPFYSTKLDSGGTGLGLAISKFILDEHGAWMCFTSEPGKGTTVAIVLPAAQDVTADSCSANG